jgi:hypothetical protein
MHPERAPTRTPAAPGRSISPTCAHIISEGRQSRTLVHAAPLGLCTTPLHTRPALDSGCRRSGISKPPRSGLTFPGFRFPFLLRFFDSSCQLLPRFPLSASQMLLFCFTLCMPPNKLTAVDAAALPCTAPRPPHPPCRCQAEQRRRAPAYPCNPQRCLNFAAAAMGASWSKCGCGCCCLHPDQCQPDPYHSLVTRAACPAALPLLSAAPSSSPWTAAAYPAPPRCSSTRRQAGAQGQVAGRQHNDDRRAGGLRSSSSTHHARFHWPATCTKHNPAAFPRKHVTRSSIPSAFTSTAPAAPDTCPPSAAPLPWLSGSYR